VTFGHLQVCNGFSRAIFPLRGAGVVLAQTKKKATSASVVSKPSLFFAEVSVEGYVELRLARTLFERERVEFRHLGLHYDKWGFIHSRSPCLLSPSLCRLTGLEKLASFLHGCSVSL